MSHSILQFRVKNSNTSGQALNSPNSTDTPVLFQGVRGGKVPSILHALAAGLRFKLHIHSDCSLVAVLGNGNELSNHDAIITWLLMRIDDGLDGPGSLSLHHLSNDLYQFLENELSTQENLSC